MNNLHNFDQNNDWIVAGELSKGNRLKQTSLKEQQAMRKAYCKANNIPYEEVELHEESGLMQGSLKVLVVVLWLFIIGVGISVALTNGSFIDFLGWWF